MYFVYVLKNNLTNKTYTGQTDNIEKRIDRHNGKLPNKLTSFTSKNKNNGKWELFYKEIFNTRQEAIIREKELKSYQGRLFIKNLISR